MRCAGLDFQTHELIECRLPEPKPPSGHDVLLRVREVGICGTDRELAAFHLGTPPPGETFLTIGHEALAEVVETGSGVSRLRRGDWIVPMIRRSCQPPCPSCARGRRDLCLSGRYTERGIFGAHGYFAEYAVDCETDVVRVPAELVDFAILVEPLSIVEKAVATALRLHEPGASTALVLGAGPIGLLAALAMRLRGLEVAVYSLEPAGHPRARLLERAGVRYLREPGMEKADIVIEASGSAKAAFAGVRVLAPLGVCCVLGAHTAYGEMPFLDLFRYNQTVFGSVNAGPDAFADAVCDLARMDPVVLRAMIRREPFAAFRSTIPAPPGAAAKIVHVF